MIRLEKWPYLRKEPLEELYAQADQSFCLVHLPVPLPLNSTRHYLLAVRRELADGKPFLCYAVYLDDQIIGKIEVTKDPDEDAELDLILKTAYVRQGYGTEALRQLKDLLVEKHWCKRITAYVNADNQAMIAVLNKNDFTEGRPFQADVVVPQAGTYRLQTVKGQEYICELAK